MQSLPKVKSLPHFFFVWSCRSTAPIFHRHKDYALKFYIPFEELKTSVFGAWKSCYKNLVQSDREKWHHRTRGVKITCFPSSPWRCAVASEGPRSGHAPDSRAGGQFFFFLQHSSGSFLFLSHSIFWRGFSFFFLPHSSFFFCKCNTDEVIGLRDSPERA